MFHKKRYLLPVLVFMVIFLNSGCADQTGMTGKYRGSEQDIPGTYSFIELKDNGEGTWETDIDLVHFRWKIRDNEIWLHTQTGGVILGELTRDGFEIELPNVGTYSFVRQNP